MPTRGRGLILGPCPPLIHLVALEARDDRPRGRRRAGRHDSVFDDLTRRVGDLEPVRQDDTHPPNCIVAFPMTSVTGWFCDAARARGRRGLEWERCAFSVEPSAAAFRLPAPASASTRTGGLFHVHAQASTHPPTPAHHIARVSSSQSSSAPPASPQPPEDGSRIE